MNFGASAHLAPEGRHVYRTSDNQLPQYKRATTRVAPTEVLEEGNRKMANMRFFATAAKGTESLVAQEVAAIGAQNIRSIVGGVHFEGGLETLYRANLWLRTANRVLMPIAEFPCPTPEALYENARKVRVARLDDG